jgi:hypothetical protein
LQAWQSWKWDSECLATRLLFYANMGKIILSADDDGTGKPDGLGGARQDCWR